MYQEERQRVLEEKERPGSNIPLPWPAHPFQEPVKRERKSSEFSAYFESPSVPIVEIRGVYIISVAARILEMHPQTLRKYEKLGLINPERTGGMLRLYSREDIRKIFLIRHLMDTLGLNLAGVEFALSVVNNLSDLERRLIIGFKNTGFRETLQKEMDRLYRRLNLPV